MNSLTPAFAKTRMDDMLATASFEFPTLLKLFDNFPEEQLYSYKPHEVSMNAADLFLHICVAEGWFADTVAAGAIIEYPKVETPATKAELRAAMSSRHEASVAKLAGLSGDELAKPIAFMGMGEFPAVTYYGWALDHLIHHRGQLSIYARGVGAKVPGIYGPSADEPMQMG